MNLVVETIERLKQHGKTTQDVIWVGHRGGLYAMEWIGFANAFKNLNYDNGYGGVEIDEYLVVVGDNWWLERHEYDGAEWWEYKEKPQTDLQTAIPFAPTKKDCFYFDEEDYAD